MMHTWFLGAVLVLIFLADTFVLVPGDVNRWTEKHILEGDKTGLLTRRLKLITSKVCKGQIWRPVTSMFLHAGMVHIVFNLMCLINLGDLLEPMLGGRLLWLFLATGIFSALCMMVLVRIEDGLGASTGIFGLLGVGIVLFLRQPDLLQSVSLWNWIVLAVMVTAGNATDNTTRLEHLTGTLGGVLAGLLL